jgi:CheY-like chemotaxis protein
MANKPAGQVLLIGSQDGGTGWTLQRRPLNLMKVLATVESLLVPQNATVPAALMPMRTSSFAASKPAAVSSASSGPSVAARPANQALASSADATLKSQPVVAKSSQPAVKEPVTAPTPMPMPAFRPAAPASPADAAVRGSVRTGMGARRAFENSRSFDNFTGLSPASAAPTDSAMDVEHILVVDDSDIALKFMRNRLSRFGFNADLVNSGEEALGKMNTRPYKFVFLDVMMEGLDGYQTCRAIKQRKYSDGKPPVVVMLTSRGGTIDKIRGTLAGCDAYLTKPLNERDLIAVLAKHDRNVARGFQETNFGSGSTGLGGNSGSGFARSVK